MLNITEQQFDELYPDLQGYYSFFNDPVPSVVSTDYFERVYLRSKLWRLNNIYTVIDKSGTPVTFRMNYAQHVVYARSRQHPRVIILKSRQQGISTLWLVSYFDDGLFEPYLNIGMMAQGVDEASTLLERTKFLWDKLSPDIKRFLNVTNQKDNAKSYSFSNHSNIFIRVSFRSTTLQRLHVSEMGKIANHSPKKAKEVKTGTLQALAIGNTGIIESTAEGKNLFKDMWDEAVSALASGQLSDRDFYPVFLSWVNDPDCVESVPQTISDEHAKYFRELEEKLGVMLRGEQKYFWVQKYRELGGEIFQEYPALPEEAFTAAKDGTYYSRDYMELVVRAGKRRPELYDKNLPVDVYIDIGVDDYFVLVFVQEFQGEKIIIDEYWNNGYALEHYVEFVLGRTYRTRYFNMPHDAAQRQVSVGDKHGRAKRLDTIARELLSSHGVKVRVLKKQGILEGIQACRGMLRNLSIDTRCTYIHECWLNYSKEWDDKLEVWKQTPLHDEYSHGADVLRQIALDNMRGFTEVDTSRPSTSYAV